MKMMRKIGALVLLLAMLAVISLAGADPTNITADGKVGEELEILTTTKYQVMLVKELKIYNTEGKDIYLPRVTFNYAITPVTQANPNLTITDTHGHIGTVYTGVGTPTITSSVTYAPAGEDSNYVTAEGASTTALTQPVTASNTGVSVYKGIMVDFSTVAFPHAGVYRYKITETAGSDYDASGVVQQNSTSYDSERYLDVYVRMTDTSDPADGVYDTSEIYGYVCFTADPTNIIATGQTGENETAMGKTNGFTGATGGHEYKTYNIEVTKMVRGNLAEKGHKFPITVKLTNSNSVIGALINMGFSTGTVIEGVETGGSNNYATLASENTVKLGLADTEKIAMYGIPTLSSVTFTVTDLNTTYDIYTASVAEEGDSESEIKVKLNGTGNALASVRLPKDAYAVSDTIGTGNKHIVVWNILTEISPTGYVTRFAPYALILIGGIALLIIAMKRRNHKEDD